MSPPKQNPKSPKKTLPAEQPERPDDVDKSHGDETEAPEKNAEASQKQQDREREG